MSETPRTDELEKTRTDFLAMRNHARRLEIELNAALQCAFANHAGAWYTRDVTPPIGKIWASDGEIVWSIYSNGEPISKEATLVLFWTEMFEPKKPQGVPDIMTQSQIPSGLMPTKLSIKDKVELFFKRLFIKFGLISVRRVIKGIQSVPNETERAVLAYEIFGRGGFEMLTQYDFKTPDVHQYQQTNPRHRRSLH